VFGLLNVDKPPGMTSRDVVNVVQRLMKPTKVGHAGTLDPLATGVLVVAVGPATRLIDYVHRMAKAYHATFLLGRTSDTEDIEGEVVELVGAPLPSRDQICAVLPQFIGTIQQRPPDYSAVKVRGQRAYKLARRGQNVELAPRPVEVFAIEVIRYEFPELEVIVHCGSGTYVRTLGRDIARALGTDAVMSGLRRTAIGSFRAESAVPIEGLDADVLRQSLLSPILALGDIPRAIITSEDQARLAFGQAIRPDGPITGDELAAVSSAGDLVAVLRRTDAGWSPAINFSVSPATALR
jgi:tRNA pseudouridine55 synthase